MRAVIIPGARFTLYREWMRMKPSRCGVIRNQPVLNVVIPPEAAYIERTENVMDTTERLVIDLPSELVAKLRELVASGEFKSESHVVETFLKSAYYGEGDEMDDDELAEVRAAVAEGAADVEAGRFIEADEVFRELREQIKTHKAPQD